MERVFLIGILVLTLTLTVVCIGMTLKEVKLSPSKAAGEESNYMDDSTGGNDNFNPANDAVKLPPIKDGQPLKTNVTMPVPKQPKKQPAPKKKFTGTVIANPTNNQQFERVLASPQRDKYLLQIVEKQWSYCYLSLQKIIHLQLTQLEPQLREIYNRARYKAGGTNKNYYYRLQLLRAIWKLHGHLSPEEEEMLEKARLKPRGQ